MKGLEESAEGGTLALTDIAAANRELRMCIQTQPPTVNGGIAIISNSLYSAI